MRIESKEEAAVYKVIDWQKEYFKLKSENESLLMRLDWLRGDLDQHYNALNKLAKRFEDYIIAREGSLASFLKEEAMRDAGLL